MMTESTDMSHTIQLPDDLYEKVAAAAAEQGRPVDAVVESYVLYAMQHLAPPQPPAEYVYDPATDPILPFIGAFDSGDQPPLQPHEHDLYFAGEGALDDDAE